MTMPVQVEFQNLLPLPTLASEIRWRATKLQRWAPEMDSCHVTLVPAPARPQQNPQYRVCIDVCLPGGHVFAAQQATDQDIAQAARGAFDAITQQLQMHMRRLELPRRAPAALWAQRSST